MKNKQGKTEGGMKRPRGRPKKNQVEFEAVTLPKRPRGRPKKVLPEISVAPKKRGRPRKIRLEPVTPKTMGRPKLGDDARKITVSLRISPNEFSLWTKAAQKAGMKLGAFIAEPLRRTTKDKARQRE